MPFVTTLSFRSGDRTALDSVVEEIRETARRKGVELKGPHTHPPVECSAPLYWETDAETPFDRWEYSVYRRTLRIVGHEDIAREIAGTRRPDSVGVEIEVEQIRSAGSG
jgi:ribosomal protein S10